MYKVRYYVAYTRRIILELYAICMGCSEARTGTCLVCSWSPSVNPPSSSSSSSSRSNMPDGQRMSSSLYQEAPTGERLLKLRKAHEKHNKAYICVFVCSILYVDVLSGNTEDAISDDSL